MIAVQTLVSVVTRDHRGDSSYTAIPVSALQDIFRVESEHGMLLREIRNVPGDRFDVVIARDGLSHAFLSVTSFAVEDAVRSFPRES